MAQLVSDRDTCSVQPTAGVTSDSIICTRYLHILAEAQSTLFDQVPSTKAVQVSFYLAQLSLVKVMCLGLSEQPALPKHYARRALRTFSISLRRSLKNVVAVGTLGRLICLGTLARGLHSDRFTSYSPPVKQQQYPHSYNERHVFHESPRQPWVHTLTRSYIHILASWPPFVQTHPAVQEKSGQEKRRGYISSHVPPPLVEVRDCQCEGGLSNSLNVGA